MITIKEKAEEHAPYTRDDSWNKIQRCEIAQTSFEAGANYVLEQIEEMLSLKNQYTSKGDFCDDLEWRIEQLKK